MQVSTVRNRRLRGAFCNKTTGVHRRRGRRGDVRDASSRSSWGSCRWSSRSTIFFGFVCVPPARRRRGPAAHLAQVLRAAHGAHALRALVRRLALVGRARDHRGLHRVHDGRRHRHRHARRRLARRLAARVRDQQQRVRQGHHRKVRARRCRRARPRPLAHRARATTGTRATGVMARGMFVWTSMPLYCLFLVISALNQCVRKASCFPYSKEIETEEERAGIFTETVQHMYERMKNWRWTSVLKSVLLLGTAYMALNVRESARRALPLSCARARTPTSLSRRAGRRRQIHDAADGVAHHRVLGDGALPVTGIIIAIGLFLFLLPPVPGVPIYLTGGILLVASGRDHPHPSLGIWGSVVYTGFVSARDQAVRASTLQQKCIGGFLAGKAWIRQLVGVNSDMIRTMKLILGEQPRCASEGRDPRRRARLADLGAVRHHGPPAPVLAGEHAARVGAHLADRALGHLPLPLGREGRTGRGRPRRSSSPRPRRCRAARRVHRRITDKKVEENKEVSARARAPARARARHACSRRPRAGPAARATAARG